VDKASNGQIALDLMKSRQYDVVLIDINMPVMDGFETVRLFRDFEKNNIPAYFPSDVSELSDAVSEMGGEKGHAPKVVELGSFKPRQTNNAYSPTSQTKDRKSQQDASELTTPLNQSSSTQVGTSADLAVIVSTNSSRKPSLSADYYHQLIIGMSTDIDNETRDKALSCGMDYFLPKPFTLQKFIETIKRSMDGE
jgi:CheY-like chemotaxis protein